jgi:O-acetyl-ADP-ribose deacetylase (regulator of RNase III)
MPLGAAACAPTGRLLPSYLIATPTMHGPADNISATMNVALACAAALQAARLQNAVAPGSIRTIAMPGLGAGTGCVAPAVCADLMYAAWKLFEGRSFDGLHDLRAALENELGDLGPLPPTPAVAYHGPRPAVLPRPYHGHHHRVSA